MKLSLLSFTDTVTKLFDRNSCEDLLFRTCQTTRNFVTEIGFKIVYLVSEEKEVLEGCPVA
jgi:hypothetical protein